MERQDLWDTKTPRLAHFFAREQSPVFAERPVVEKLQSVPLSLERALGYALVIAHPENVVPDLRFAQQVWSEPIVRFPDLGRTLKAPLSH